MILTIDKNSLFKYSKKERSKCDKKGLHII